MAEVAEKVTTKWSVDPTHSEVQFKVKHLVISTVTGAFKKFQGEVISNGESFEDAKVTFSIDVNSIDTNQADRDAHLKSADFFDAEQHPTMDFSGALKKSSNDYSLEGELTVRGTKKPVTLNVDFGGVATDPWGNTRAGFEITGKLNRKDYGLNWSAITEAGGVVVADEVKLLINVEVIKG